MPHAMVVSAPRTCRIPVRARLCQMDRSSDQLNRLCCLLVFDDRVSNISPLLCFPADAAKASSALSRDPLRYHPLLKLAAGNDSPTTDPEDDARPPQQPTGGPTGLSGLGEGGPSSPNRTLLAKLSTGVNGTRLAPTHGAGSTVSRRSQL
jgi:hypothetical protein